MKPTLFIADLHLTPNDPATEADFAAFLAGPARDAAALYILGDLFDYWVGDDQLVDPFYRTQAARLQALSNQGIPIYFMRGNRDFMTRERLATAAGFTHLPDPCVIHIDGQNILLGHGDLWCSADRKYQRFRKIIRSPITQWLLLRMPKRWRLNKAEEARARSRQHTPRKPESYTDVTPSAIRAAMQKAGVTLLIHGHTHRPLCHAEAYGTRWVLPDWQEGRGGYLLLSGQDIALLRLDGSPYLPLLS